MSLAASPRLEQQRLTIFVVASVLALAVREVAARTVGFGDSEALYASYALIPQPAYLDHPGLIGLVARVFAASGEAPSPHATHAFTALCCSVAPFVTLLAGRVLGANRRASLDGAIAVAVAPEIAIGLFGLTPDLLLFFAWMSALVLFGRALMAAPASNLAAALFAGAGLALGTACASKVSGLTLALAFVVTLLAPGARTHARTVWPWLTLALAALIFSPVVLYEAQTGWPMIHHRLVATQHDAGLSARNAVAIVLGQVAYVSPGLFLVGLYVGRRLFVERSRDAVTALLAAATFVPLALLGGLCLWSRVAEPHWLAPAWLSLPLFDAARSFACSVKEQRTAGTALAQERHRHRPGRFDSRLRVGPHSFPCEACPRRGIRTSF